VSKHREANTEKQAQGSKHRDASTIHLLLTRAQNKQASIPRQHASAAPSMLPAGLWVGLRFRLRGPGGVRPAEGARGAGSRTASRGQGLCHPTAAWEEEATKDQSALIFDSSASAA
jgi:hypothetical protein